MTVEINKENFYNFTCSCSSKKKNTKVQANQCAIQIIRNISLQS
jgi:hypothetical protein